MQDTTPSKFQEEPWQKFDIHRLLMRHDATARDATKQRGGVKTGPIDPMTGKHLHFGGSANWSEMGCLSGSTSINLNRAKKGFMTTIEKAYKAFNGLNNHPRANYDRSMETYAQAYVNGRIRQHKVLAILDKGIKEVVKVTLEDGRTLTCTPDHKIALIDGSWVEAGKLTQNNYVLIRGSFGGRNITVETPKIVTNRSLGDSRFIDKDGYVRVLDRTHPRRNASNHVYEHILVMEKHLERHVTKHEHIHHINKNKSDNRIQNLELLSSFQHKSLHAKTFLGTYGIWGNRVKSVEQAGTDHVYDLVMDEPFHNFVANGIVVHNCYKTSTGLWFIEQKIKEANLNRPPSILIITNKSGKGTFFEAVPEIFKGWAFFNIETTGMDVMINGRWMRLPPSKQKFVPKKFGMPTVCIAHYNIFSFSNKDQFEEYPDDHPDSDLRGRPVRDENGKFVLKEWRQADYIIDHPWDFVWTDEFHRMKDKDSRWTVTIKKINTVVGRHGSTGTGFINRPNEVWSLLNWLYPTKYDSYWDFHNDYCAIDDWDGYAKVVGVKPEKKAEFRKLVRTIGVRRTLDETHPDIEKAVFTQFDIELNPKQRKMYNEIKMELATLDKNGVELYSANVLSLLQRLRQICVGTPEVIEDRYDPVLDRRIQKVKLTEPSSKLDTVMEILEGLQWDEDRKEPLVVFSNFKDPLEMLKARLDKHNEVAAGTDMEIPYIHMDVSDNDQERYKKWYEDFPTMKYRVFMSTLQLGGESINLTPAHHLVFLDRSWSPKDNNQGIGRIRRPGQKSVPNIIHINALNTTDQYIEEVNMVKNGWFKQIFGEEA